jgi:FixJ family two-component response regulator
MKSCRDLACAGCSTGVNEEYMSVSQEMVFVAHRDSSLRERLRELLVTEGLNAISVGAAAELAANVTRPDCVILDLELPDLERLDLQQWIAHTDVSILALAPWNDIAASVRASASGVVTFLAGPLEGEDLLHAVHKSLQQARRARERRARLAQLHKRWSDLSRREREVLPLIARGLLNKEVAIRLHTSATAIQVHRGRIMQKMAASSVAELVRMLDALRVR